VSKDLQKIRHLTGHLAAIPMLLRASAALG
jgi:hypothetical protein